jgi:cell pole-organizing protein PopZ
MNDAKATQEPSMEEILASIRRIISEEGNADDATEKKPEPPLAPPPPPPPPPSPQHRFEPEFAEPTEHVAGPGVGEPPLVSPDVAEASASVMAQLIARRAKTVVEVQSPGQGLLVETLVRQAVEPMLRDWLDANLQGIVERLVRREVERIARRAELS